MGEDAAGWFFTPGGRVSGVDCRLAAIAPPPAPPLGETSPAACGAPPRCPARVQDAVKKITGDELPDFYNIVRRFDLT